VVTAADPVVEEIELAVLLEAVNRRYGHELREWEAARVRNRVRQLVADGHFSSISAFQERILRDDTWLDKLMTGLWSRPNRGMFADPAFWRTVRWKIVPLLRTWPTVRAWVGGCATGEDAWSLSVLLEEEGLGPRATVHATDLDEATVVRAREHMATPAELTAWEANYRLAGGLGSLASFFARAPAEAGAPPTGAALRRPVCDRIAWSRHVPGIEPSFNEFHLILFRNPFVWTDRRARERVGTLLRDSQVMFGFLCLDDAETLRAMPRGTWDLLDRELAIARRIA
jgi:chemotaxis protein methyltransferase CheR